MHRLVAAASAALFALLLAPLAAPAQKPDLENLLEARTIKGKSGDASLPYRLLKPDGYSKDGKESYPLVVFLHGAGERGSNNKAQLKHGVANFATEATRKKHPCFLVAPQCPQNGFWSRVNFGAKKQGMSKEPSVQGRLVLELIDAMCKEYRIDRKRIYITGLSMGGYGSWDLLSRKPDLFAAGIPVCGGGDEAQAEKLKDIPLWVFHGDKDFAVPVARSRNMVEAIKKAGGKPKYTEYAGVGHDSWTQTYSNPKVIDWLFEQKKP